MISLTGSYLVGRLPIVRSLMFDDKLVHSLTLSLKPTLYPPEEVPQSSSLSVISVICDCSLKPTLYPPEEVM